jgi:hypothetical protein
MDVVHSAEALLEGQRAVVNLTKPHHLIVNLDGNSMSLSIWKGRSLSFFNTFKVGTEEDILYFILYALDRFDLSPKDMTVSFTGIPHKPVEELKLINKFVPVFTPIGTPGNLRIDRGISIHEEALFTAISTFICA